MPTYTVLGVREATSERWADSFEAADAHDAERQAHDACRCEGGSSDLLIAGVIAGAHVCEDTDKTYANE